jgi:hypothetical protein
MSTYRFRAFALATVIVAGLGAPLASASAAPAASSNVVVNAGGGSAPTTGVYDGNDQYRDAKGFPLPGWDILFFPPS